MEQNVWQGETVQEYVWQIKWLGLSTTLLGIPRYILYLNIKFWHQASYDIRHLWDQRVAGYHNSYCSFLSHGKGSWNFSYRESQRLNQMQWTLQESYSTFSCHILMFNFQFSGGRRSVWRRLTQVWSSGRKLCVVVRTVHCMKYVKLLSRTKPRPPQNIPPYEAQNVYSFGASLTQLHSY